MADNNNTTTEELKKDSAKALGAEEARGSEEAPKKKKKIIFVSNPQNSKMGGGKPKTGTGAAAGIGAKYLARKDSKNLLVIGCGNIAMHSIAATLITMPNIEKVIICNPRNYDSLLSKKDNITEAIKKLLNEIFIKKFFI